MAKKRITLKRAIHRVIGWDPGRRNCALAVYGPAGVEDTDVIEGTADDIQNLSNFADNVERQLEWYGPDACAVERYQLRAGTGFVGNMEAVNLMIGVLFEQCRQRGIPCALVTPSTHKVWAGREKGARKRKGKLAMDTCPEFERLATEHEADAANVARYAALKIFTEEELETDG